MNFLAHIFLSGDDDLLRIGNFMADGIRGNDYQSLPMQIQKGVILHREIDTFTDAHPTFRQSTKRLHSRYHHYAGVIVDVVYDHFLAKNWLHYSDEPLEQYVDGFYQSLHQNSEFLTKRTQQILPIMERENWLYSYRTIDGISHILKQMDRRTKNISKMTSAVEELAAFYPEFESEFTQFFAELQQFVSSKISEI